VDLCHLKAEKQCHGEAGSSEEWWEKLPSGWLNFVLGTFTSVIV
jgi:hypothetical protein